MGQRIPKWDNFISINEVKTSNVKKFYGHDARFKKEFNRLHDKYMYSEVEALMYQ